MTSGSFALFAFLALAAGTPSWPEKYTYSPDNMPVLQIRLAPPKKALAEVNAVAARLVAERKLHETESMRELERAYDISAEDGAGKIQALLDRMMMSFKHSDFFQQKRSRSQSGSAKGQRAPSFLAAAADAQKPGGEEIRTRVNLLPVQSPPEELETKMEEIESVRRKHEGSVFQQARNEMDGLTTIVVNEAEAQITRYANAVLRTIGSNLVQEPRQRNASEFREGLQLPSAGLQLTTNLRVLASAEPFPTVASLVEDLERQRDASEGLLSNRILELELKLLRTHNSFLASTLEAHIAEVLSFIA